jgi:hypothetical protein
MIIKKNTMKHTYFFLVGLLLFSACKEKEFYRGPFEDDGKAPGAITGVQVENLPGAAKITYEVPDDPDLWYVEADYDIRKNKQAHVKSSSYNNYIIVQGFGDSSVHHVKLYSVDRGQNKSGPVTVDVKPDTPPVFNTFKSLTISSTFGGALITFANKDSANLAILPLTKDSLNLWVSAGEIYHTSSPEGQFAVRGYDTTKRVFAVYVRDEWGNVSDTLVKEIKPLYEQELDKSLFKAVNLPSDYTVPNLGSQVIEHAWNDSRSENDFTTQPGHGLPQWFTIDLGVKAQLSRLVVWTRMSSRFLYASGAVKKWEIWGSNDPNPNGDWDSTWTLLLTCEAVKPSGLPVGQNTAEDKAFADAGWEFVFPFDTPPVRYLRWKTLANWGNVSHITITELTLYGKVD